MGEPTEGTEDPSAALNACVSVSSRHPDSWLRLEEEWTLVPSPLSVSSNFACSGLA